MLNSDVVAPSPTRATNSPDPVGGDVAMAPGVVLRKYTSPGSIALG